MAIGDDAKQAGYLLVPDTGEDGRVKHGARELNRTRDYIALVKGMIASVWPVSKGGTGATSPSEARVNLGISTGAGDPSGGNAGDIYFKVV